MAAKANPKQASRALKHTHDRFMAQRQAIYAKACETGIEEPESLVKIARAPGVSTQASVVNSPSILDTRRMSNFRSAAGESVPVGLGARLLHLTQRRSPPLGACRPREHGCWAYRHRIAAPFERSSAKGPRRGGPHER